MHFNWLRSLFADNRSTKRTSRKRRPWVSAVETLEARAVPAIYHVTGLTDGAGVISASGLDFNATTLRAAITDANLQPGDDTIVLPSGTYTINTSGEGELLITSNISIDGAGASETIIDNGYRSGRVFHITGDTTQLVTFEGVTITGGLVTDQGGGILLEGGTLNLTQSTVTYNAVDSATGDVFGGGISVNSATLDVATLNVTDSTISYNSAYGGDGALTGHQNGYDAYGGGIATRIGKVNILRSTIDHNNVYGGNGVAETGYYIGGGGRGGGIFITLNSSVKIENTTIANNSANGGNALNSDFGTGGQAYGGAIFNTTSVSIRSSTIAYNNSVGGMKKDFTLTGSVAGGVAAFGVVNIGSTIIAQNTSRFAPDVFNTVTSVGYNLIGISNSSDGWNSTLDKLGSASSPIDPLFTGNIVSDYGGPTLTLGLQATSPALNAGFNFGTLTTDQRGGSYLRTFGAAPEIGAFELQGPGVITTAGSTVYTANTPATVVDAGVLVFGTQNLTGATVTISGGLAAGDVLDYPAVIGNITASYLNGVLTLTGDDSPGNYLLALRSITYRNTNFIPDTGDRTISFAATDSIGTSGSATRLVTITIPNTAPTVANLISPQSATEDAVFSFTFAVDTFDDVDQGDVLTYTAAGLPTWLTFDGSTRTFTGTPANGDVTIIPLTITVTATDSFLAT
ncbi:MAG: putative Ig domain-containing protein, partial [Planctomycetota bacterium]